MGKGGSIWGGEGQKKNILEKLRNKKLSTAVAEEGAIMTHPQVS